MAGFATLNDRDVIEAQISIPRVGAWAADLVVDAPGGITGAAALTIDGGLALQGTVTRSGVFNETAFVRLAPGSDGLRRDAMPRHYTATTFSIVLRDLLRAAGEVQATTASPGVLAVTFPAWTTIRQPIGNAIAVLVARGAAAGTAWRMLSNGSLWVGPETWPDSGLGEADVDELDQLPHLGEALLGTAAPRLLPGTTLGGRRVSYVDHTIRAGELRTRAWFDPAI